MNKSKHPSEQEAAPIRAISLESRLPTLSTAKQQIRQMLDITPLTYPELDAAKIIYPGMKDVNTLNAFRDLRTKLMQKAGKNNFCIMVSPLAPGGGGTYISQNLAASIALDFEKTALLVDCNVNSKSDNTLFSAATDYGLTDYLEDTSLSASDIIYASGIPRLRITPVGSKQADRSEFFSSDRMEEFLTEIKSRYSERFIVLDAPPINSSPDARLLADLCDYSVLVVPYGRVTKLQITAGINAIPSEKFAGVVFNN